MQPGQPGEIAIRGPHVMVGYWQRPDETAKVMTRDGCFKLVERKKDMISCAGFNVYPNEIEDAVSTLPGVLECAAVDMPDDKAGEAIKLVSSARTRTSKRGGDAADGAGAPISASLFS